MVLRKHYPRPPSSVLRSGGAGKGAQPQSGHQEVEEGGGAEKGTPLPALPLYAPGEAEREWNLGKGTGVLPRRWGSVGQELPPLRRGSKDPQRVDE